MGSVETAMHEVAKRAETVGRVAAAERESYATGADRPLGSYLVLLGTYLTAVIGFTAWVRRRGRPLPERLALADLALMAAATHRLTRTVAKDSVTAAVRAPFTRFVDSAGQGEVNEVPRGQGLRHAVGELVTCPFCLAQWIATGLVFGLVVAPRTTRLAATILTTVSASDVMHLAYAKLQG